MIYVRLVAGAVLAVLVGVQLARRKLAIVTVRGLSMRSTFRPGDRVLVLRCRGNAVRGGQVVVIEEPDPDSGWSRPAPPIGRLDERRWSIKRVAAVAHDPVPQGIPVAASYVPDEHLVVLGDTDLSSDSRAFGFLPASRVLGVTIARLPRPG